MYRQKNTDKHPAYPCFFITFAPFNLRSKNVHFVLIFGTFRFADYKLDKNKWEHYININTDFVWYEDTEKGKNILKNIDSIPNDFRDSFLSLFNHTSCFYNYNNKKNCYNVGLIFHKELKRITIYFERKIEKLDLELLFSMANYLEALLLIDGKTVIDQQFIEELERKQ